MNEQLRKLMLEAGYAAPELAGRANNLAELIVRECADYLDAFNRENHVEEGIGGSELKEHFGLK